MATHARQQYFADESSLSKEKREFSIADEVQQKIDSVEEGAQVNKIETVKVNGTALVPDANKTVNVEVPDVIDNLYSTSTDDALSAKQGKVLYDYLQNIASRGRFLSNWNCATGLPVTNPTENPYPYKAGDYYSVSNVASGGGTNYRPDGNSYIIGQASTTTETDVVKVADFYLYDGTNWLLLVNTERQIAIDSSLSTTSTNPVENRVITNALNGKHPGAISNVAPSNPVEGMLWYDTTNDELKVYDGSSWKKVGGSDIVYVTQAEYNALLPGALTDNKHYFIYSTSGGGWQPGVNTLAYRPLTDDANDHSGNSRNLTLNNCSLTTFGGLKCLQFSSGYASTDIGTTFNHDWTVSLWHYNSINTTEDMGFFSQGITQSNQCILVMDWGTNGKVYGFSNYYDTLAGPRVPVLSWEYLTVTYEYSTKTIKLFVGGDLKGTTILTNQYSLPNTTFLLGDVLLKTNSEFSGYMNEVIVENKVRAAQEIVDYYNQTKANYGIS